MNIFILKKTEHFLSYPYTLLEMQSNIYEQVGGAMVMKYGGLQYENANAVKKSWPILELKKNMIN
ncbi:hypothetical protein [Geomicrobium sp. JCM 19039]|uniref:hypothetical protein n=1 Tax=Geomicrobium sp. JCM 19039 TaxID=1460636 RepID=UPI0005AA79CF|nr:hypothetical protein [Geomicrobium sp. JCM 19039]